MSLLALALAAAAELTTVVPVTVAFRLHGESYAKSASLVFRATTTLAEIDPLQPETKIETRLDRGPVEVALPAGNWALDVFTDGLWHQRQYLSLAGPAELLAELWPAVILVGSVRTDDGRPPGILSARFETSGPRGPAGESACRLVGDTFTCVVPAQFDALSLRAPGYMSRVLGRTAPSRRRIDVGVLELARGQSIAGRVQPGRGRRLDLRSVVVSATPRSAGALTRARARASAQGAFQIDGVAPGEYVVSASGADGLTTPELIVKVLAGAESVLSRPLILDAPGKLSVVVIPPLAPDEARWDVSVSRYVAQDRLEPVSTNEVPVVGTWETSLPPGRYRVTVSWQGSEWFSEVVEMSGTDLDLTAVVTARPVRGTVYLGDRPLAASLRFSTRDTSVHCESDGEGRFAFLAPSRAKGPWTVRVIASSPPVERSIVGVSSDSDEPLRLRLPDTSLAGVVVDVEGRPVGSALVNIASDGELLQPSTAADGTFAVHGIEPGSYEVQATDGERQSDWTSALVEPDQAGGEVRLVIRTAREVRGRVFSAFGPVAGARVAIQATNLAAAIVESTTTDARGEFLLVLPPDATELDVRVAPPGFAYTIGHVRWQPHDPLLVEVDQRGGTVVVAARQTATLTLRHEGATEWLETLRDRWSVSVLPDGSVAIESMEPGVYSLCDGARCVTGMLGPLGALRLQLD